MPESASSTERLIPLEDLIALNDEIASLARANVPIELGLGGFGGGASRNLRRISERIADRMAAGDSLDQALADQGKMFPRVYLAVVRAGLKSGRLPEALESVAAFSRSFLELRRCLTLAFIYPAIVLLLAYGMFVVFVAKMVPWLAETYHMFRLPEDLWWLRLLQFLNETLSVWGPALPILFMLLLIWTAYSSAAIIYARTHPIMGVLATMPLFWMRWVLRNAYCANFAEMLGILVRHEVPLPEAVPMAAEISGSPALRFESRLIAERLQSGRTLAECLQPAKSLPPFLKWMMISGEQQGALDSALRQVSGIYRRRAYFQAEWVKIVVPVLITLFVGGGAVLIYALSLFIPFSSLLKNLSSDLPVFVS